MSLLSTGNCKIVWNALCGGRFRDTIDWTVSLAPQGWGDLDYRKPIKISTQKRAMIWDFYVKTQVEKNHKEKRENSLLSRSYSEFMELYCGYNFLDSVPFLVRGEGLFVLNYWAGGGWNNDEIGVTVAIFTCEIIITTAIMGTWLLGLPVENPPQSITALDVIFVGEVRLCNWSRKLRRFVVVAIYKRRSGRPIDVAILLGAKVSSVLERRSGLRNNWVSSEEW